MSGISLTKNVFRYAAMPEVMPRVQSLVFGGFGYIPFFIATLYQMVGLLPRDHPYLMQRNIGRFGIRHVVAQAASNITFSLKNIDQIIMFLAVIVGIVIFIVQIFALLSVIVMQPAMALPTSWAQFFTVVNVGYRSQDIAFMMLDMVFGVPHPSLGATTVPAGMGFFESCVGSSVVCQDSNAAALTPTPSALFTLVSATNFAQMSPLAPQGYTMFPFPFHQGLHALFGVYSTALLIIATMIMSYFVATILGETMQSGTPFGRRFNKTWAPLRIVIAFGLLMPLTIGLNSSQYVVLYAAKFGSAFATNGWRYFNDTLTTSYLGSGQQLISVPNAPSLEALTQFMYVAKTCEYVYNFYHSRQLKTAVPADLLVKPYLLRPESVAPAAVASYEIQSATNYNMAKAELGNNTRNMKIRFGVRDQNSYASEHGFVSPICGEITIPYSDGTVLASQEQYVRTIQEGYFDLVRNLWFDNVGTSIWVGVDGGGTFVATTTATSRRYRKLADDKVNGLPGVGVGPLTDTIDLNDVYVSNLNQKVQTIVETTISAAVGDAITSGLWGGPYNATAPSADSLYSRGWASAGIWYNRVAQLNGQVSAAAFAAPMVSAYPAILEQVSAVKTKYDATLLVKDRFKPEAASVGDLALLLDKQYGVEFASVLYYAYDQWRRSSGVESELSSNNNPIIGFIKYFFGLSGLYNMSGNQAANTHPLAQLSGVGKSLVEGSIRSLSYAGMATVIGGFGLAEDLMAITANFLISFAMMGLTIGFILFYIVPFLPFIYFFFAVGGWVKGIFEAMVGAPLWALAHIRIDGTGLPGGAAINGYFLIFEVFLRPILIVFGMLASISTYSALVSVLNSIFSMVTENVGGFDMQSEIVTSRNVLNYMRSEVDAFFFTVIYAIIVYMLGMSSFKLVDTMPNNILRWMGQSVATFGDQREDPAASLVGRASMGSQQALGKIGQGLQSSSQAVIKS